MIFKWLWISDLHFGVSSVPIGAITESVTNVYESGKRRGIQAVVIGGDTTDRPLELINDYSIEFIEFGAKFLKDAGENGITIIVIEGTPSHDWKQARLFESLKRTLEIDVNLIYISTLSIVNLENFGNVLVVPDQWRSNCHITLTEVKALLKEKNLEQVDWAFMHGSMKFQVPRYLQKRLDLHDEEEYCKLVKKGVFIGHEHTYSTYKHIFCSGSIERTKHGQEEEKGGLFVEELASDKIFVEFIRNAKAQIFKDVMVDKLSESDILNKVEDSGIDLRTNCNIRLVCTENPTFYSDAIKKFSIEYPNIKWSVKAIISDEPSQEDFQLENADIEFSKINLDSGTIEIMLMDRIANKYPDSLNDLKELYNDIVNGE